MGNRPISLNGVTKRVKTGCGNLLVTINFDTFGYPVEVICTMGKAGGCAAAQVETIGRMISVTLQNNDPKDRIKQMDGIIKELKDIKCHVPTEAIKSCADGIAIALDNYMEAKR